MPYKTVNLKPETYERLRMYQIGGKSLNDVIEELMDAVEPEGFYREALAVHRRRVKEMRERGGLPMSELEEEVTKEG